MDVSCPACAARYTANAEKLRGKTARMRCKACDTVWLVSGPSKITPSFEEGSERRAAIKKIGAERERRDLFAGRPNDVSSVRQTLHPRVPDSLTAGLGIPSSGARNESSVLFTVSALGAAPHSPSNAPAPDLPPRAAASAPDEDDGIIDLHTLTSSPRPRGGEVATLFPSEPPPGAFARDADGTDGFRVQKRIAGKKKLLALSVVAAAVAVVLIGLVFAFKGPDVTPASAAAPPLPTLTTVIAPSALVVAPAASAAEPSVDPSPLASSKANDVRTGKLRKTGGKGSGERPAAATGATPKPSGASDPCHCNGDFTCALRCSAKGK